MPIILTILADEGGSCSDIVGAIVDDKDLLNPERLFEQQQLILEKLRLMDDKLNDVDSYLAEDYYYKDAKSYFEKETNKSIGKSEG